VCHVDGSSLLLLATTSSTTNCWYKCRLLYTASMIMLYMRPGAARHPPGGGGRSDGCGVGCSSRRGVIPAPRLHEWRWDLEVKKRGGPQADKRTPFHVLGLFVTRRATAVFGCVTHTIRAPMTMQCLLRPVVGRPLCVSILGISRRVLLP
jgi:hypothetical protein